MEKRPFASAERLEDVVAEYPTPLQVYDERTIRSRVRALLDAFSWNQGFREYFAPELAALQDLQAKGLVQISDEGFQVTPMGWYFVRGVAMLFDRYLQADKNRARFSRII